MADQVQDPANLVDRVLTNDHVCYDTLVTQADACEVLVRSWYHTWRDTIGEPGDAARSDEEHIHWRVERLKTSSGAQEYPTLRAAMRDAWPIPRELEPGTTNPNPGPAPFPPESGPIEKRGIHWFLPDGRVWDYRGVTGFTLFARHRRGEDISSQIAFYRAMGANVVREFVAGVNWDPPWYGDFNDFKRPFDDPQFSNQLDAHYTAMAAAGLRVESTICTYRIDDATWRRAAQMVYDVAEHHWNATFTEAVNEPWVGHGSPEAILSGVNRHGIWSAYGWQPIGNPDDSWTPCPTLDYLTPHLPRDYPHYAHNGKDLLGIRQTGNCPAIDDEPCGIADFSRPSPAQRTNNREHVVSHYATSRLFGGSTFHYDDGLRGIAPPAGSRTEEIAFALRDVWSFYPADCVLGGYSAPHLGGFPLAWTGDRQSSQVNHAYATILGSRAFAINCMPQPGWTPVGVNGWRVVASTPDGLVRLER